MISFILTKSARSASRTVSFTIPSSDPPAASATAFRLANTWRVCASVPSRRLPVAGSSPTCPDRYTVSPARIACEYGPIAAGAASVWIGCLLTRLSRCVADNVARTQEPVGLLALDVGAGLDPRVDAAEERPNALEAELLQPLRDLDRGRFVRTGAVDDHLAVDGHALEAGRDVLHVDRARSRDLPRGLLRDRGTHVDQRLNGLVLHHLAQLVDRNASHAQLLDEPVASQPLEGDPGHEPGDDDHDTVTAERGQRVHHALDRIAEHVAERHCDADP